MAPASRNTVLITGCSDGSLGSALCLAFHEAGWRVFATARNMAKLNNVREAGMETLRLDTLSQESVKDCVLAVERLTTNEDMKAGSLDMLINNAGGGYSMPVLDMDLAKARNLYELNVLSLITTTKHFLPLLRNSTRGGIVANNTSTSGLPTAVLPFAGAYNASKAAAVSLTESMRLELEPFGIRVVNLMTAMVRSTFFCNVQAPPVLPTDSLYQIAREPIEQHMAGSENSTDGMPPEQWAKQVVRNLTRSSPSYWIWAGTWATVVRILVLMNVGFADFITKPKSGLDILVKRIGEQKIKAS